jgi:hypothetical protein
LYALEKSGGCGFYKEAPGGCAAFHLRTYLHLHVAGNGWQANVGHTGVIGVGTL